MKSLVNNSRVGILAAACLLSSNVVGAQQILWDHIGGGSFADADKRPIVFDVLGDLDRDGVQDFIEGSVWSKYVVVRSGRDGSALHRMRFASFNNTSTAFGNNVAAMGLVDNDSIPDYATCAEAYSPPGASSSGLVQIFSGATHQEILRFHEPLTGHRLGAQVVRLGDLNGDGTDDFGVSSGTIFAPTKLYLGPDGVHFRDQPGITAAKRGISPYGDWNGDGCDDYLVGDSGFDGPEQRSGRVILLSGKDGSRLLSMEGGLFDGRTGRSVSLAGDWNGDGFTDVAAGSPGNSQLTTTNGLAGAYVFSGADGSILHFFDGELYCDQNSLFGWSVSSGKDVNGDGAPDLIVGAPYEPYPHDGTVQMGRRGSAFVFSGATGNLLWELVGATKAAFLGYQVQLIDDHNGDGLADWMVLAPEHDLTPGISDVEAGRLTVYAGALGDATPMCQGGPNSVGSGAVLRNTGPISVRQNALELAVTGMPQGRPVLFIEGQLAPASPFGAGELCVSLPLSILAIATTDTDGAPGEPGAARVPVDLRGEPFTAGGQVLQAGDRWTFQCLYREGGARNTSNALHVEFVP